MVGFVSEDRATVDFPELIVNRVIFFITSVVNNNYLADLFAKKLANVINEGVRWFVGRNNCNNSFFKTHVEIDERGFAKISKTAFEQIPLEIRLRILSKTLDIIGQSDTPLSMEALENALMDFKPRFTLAHCHIITYRNHIFVAKEHARQEGEKDIPAKKWIRWDRFRIWCNQPATVHAGLTKKIHKNIPYLVQQSFPIVETKKTLEKKQKLDYNLNTAHIKKIVEFIVENKG